MSYDNKILKDHKFIFDKKKNDNEESILYFGSRSNELTKKISELLMFYYC